MKLFDDFKNGNDPNNIVRYKLNLRQSEFRKLGLRARQFSIQDPNWCCRSRRNWRSSTRIVVTIFRFFGFTRHTWVEEFIKQTFSGSFLTSTTAGLEVRFKFNLYHCLPANFTSVGARSPNFTTLQKA